MSLKDEKKYNLKCEEDRSLLMSLNEKDGKYMDQLGAALSVGGKPHKSRLNLVEKQKTFGNEKENSEVEVENYLVVDLEIQMKAENKS